MKTPAPRECGQCKGGGEVLIDSGRGVKICPTCDGTGAVVPVVKEDAPYVHCAECHGSGFERYSSLLCRKCGGVGRTLKPEVYMNNFLIRNTRG